MDARDHRVAFQPGDRLPVLARLRGQARLGPARAKSTPTTISAASRPSRTNGCAADPSAAGFRAATPASPSTCSRPAAAPAFPNRASRSRISASITKPSARPCPTKPSPSGADWISIGPTGPRRLRLAVEHLAQHRGGICFMVDLDPRWVIKLLKMGKMDAVDRYKQHVIDQSLTLLRAHPQHPVHLHHAETARSALREGFARRSSASKASFAAARR